METTQLAANVQGTKAVSKANKVELITKEAIKESKAALRTECRTLGYALKMIGSIKGVNPEIAAYARKIQKDSEWYELFSSTVKRTKSGNFSPSLCIESIARGINKARRESAK